MRQISNFVVTRTDKNLPAVLDESFTAGLVYPYPHFYIFKGDENEEEYSMLKLRPLAERCANIRDSRLNNNGVGIVVMTEDSRPNEKLVTFIANIIKFVVDDIGISDYNVVTDEINSDKYMDVFYIPSKIETLPSSFTRNPKK